MQILNIGAFVTYLISALFAFLMTVLITAIQVISWPVNQVLVNQFPTLTDQITSVVNSLSSILTSIPYVLSFLPPATKGVIIFAIGTEIVLMYMFRSTYFVAKLWKIVQTIKFW